MWRESGPDVLLVCDMKVFGPNDHFPHHPSEWYLLSTKESAGSAAASHLTSSHGLPLVDDQVIRIAAKPDPRLGTRSPVDAARRERSPINGVMIESWVDLPDPAVVRAVSEIRENRPVFQDWTSPVDLAGWGRGIRRRSVGGTDRLLDKTLRRSRHWYERSHLTDTDPLSTVWPNPKPGKADIMAIAKGNFVERALGSGDARYGVVIGRDPARENCWLVTAGGRTYSDAEDYLSLVQNGTPPGLDSGN